MPWRSRTIFARFPISPSRESCSTTSRRCWRIPQAWHATVERIGDRWLRTPERRICWSASNSAASSSRRRWPIALGTRLRHGAQEGQAAGQDGPLSPTISNTAPTRSRSRPMRCARASASSCSTICSRPAERCRRRSLWCARSAPTVVAAACIIELAFLNGRAKLDVPFDLDGQLRELTGESVSATRAEPLKPRAPDRCRAGRSARARPDSR